MYAAISVPADSDVKIDLRHLHEVLAALLHRSDRNVVGAGEEHTVAPIPAYSRKRVDNGIEIRAGRFLDPVQPVLRMSDLNHHLNAPRKAPELFLQVVHDLFA